MHLRVARLHENTATFRWFGERLETDEESRFPDFNLCVDGATPLPHLRYYIAAEWAIDPSCVEFFIGHEDEGFSHDSADFSLMDAPARVLD